LGEFLKGLSLRPKKLSKSMAPRLGVFGRWWSGVKTELFVTEQYVRTVGSVKRALLLGEACVGLLTCLSGEA
jgi:hypothetical protein